MPGVADVLVILLLLGLIVVGLRRGPFASRARLNADRERGFKLGVAMAVGWIAFFFVITAIGVLKLLPLLFEP